MELDRIKSKGDYNIQVDTPIFYDPFRRMSIDTNHCLLDNMEDQDTTKILF